MDNFEIKMFFDIKSKYPNYQKCKLLLDIEQLSPGQQLRAI